MQSPKIPAPEPNQSARPLVPWHRDPVIQVIGGIVCVLALVVVWLYYGNFQYSRHDVAIRRALAEDRMDEAIPHLKAIIPMVEPKDRWRWEMKLGQAELDQKQYAEALQHFEAARQANPSLSLDREMMITNYETGHVAEGRSFVQAVLKKNPKDAAAHFYLGRELLEQGQYNQAANHLRFCIQLPRWEKRAAPLREAIASHVFGQASADPPAPANTPS